MEIACFVVVFVILEAPLDDRLTYFFLPYSYTTVVSDRDRFSQKENPEIELTSVTGLLYLDAIALLKNTTAELSDCTYNVEGCAIKLCNRTVPSPSDYNLATIARYAPFTLNSEDISGDYPEQNVQSCLLSLNSACSKYCVLHHSVFIGPVSEVYQQECSSSKHKIDG